MRPPRVKAQLPVQPREVGELIADQQEIIGGNP
jgi:hypothetical protein